MELFVLLIIGYFVYLLLSGKKQEARTRRPPFKKLYELDQVQSISNFEDKMVRGMLMENKEVFVTAFVNETHVLRVTATIGSRYKCHSSDNTNLWGEKAVAKGASAIRQYHNHPDLFRRSFPSKMDKNTHHQLKPFIEQWDLEYQSFLVYKSWLGRAKIKEYN
ncbi:MAG: hypothetical protein HQ557_01250 [Bacteroidetes bacterium]|nr:hypothetical protein [Bacteroidota bacterium]